MSKKYGFTIVELLIVIVVIGMLAAVTIVAFNGVQQRARDTKRISDGRGIAKALEQYKAIHGTYPSVGYSGLGSQSDWEASAREAAGEFIAPLKSFGYSGGVPVDPINDATNDADTEARAQGKYGYYYHLYSAGTHGCDASRGRYYVFGIMNLETVSAEHPDSPGHTCGARDWGSEYDWVVAGYEN